MYQVPTSLWFQERPAKAIGIWTVFWLLIISLYSSAIAAFLSLFGVFTISPTLFLTVLCIQVVLASGLAAVIYLQRSLMTIVTKSIVLNTAVTVVWWGFAQSLLAFLVTNFNANQASAIARFWMWGAPLAVLVVGACAFFIARPLLRNKDLQKIHTYSFRFPKLFTYTTTGVTAAGYIIATFAVSRSVGLPWIEIGKLVILGGVSALIVGAFVLSVTEALMQSIRRTIGNQYKVSDHSKQQLAHRILGMSFIVSVGTMLFLGVVVLQSYEQMTITSIEQLLNQTTKQFIQSRISLEGEELDDQMSIQLSLSPRTQTYTISPEQAVSAPDVSAETIGQVKAEDGGTIVDYYSTVTVVQFFVDPITQAKVMVVVPMRDFYEPIISGMQRYIVVTAVGIAALMTIVLVSVIRLSSRLQALSRAVRQARNSREPFTFNTFSADELEDLSFAFEYYINKSNELRMNLEDKVQQRTNALLEAEQEARKAEMTVVQKNTQIEQEKRQVAEEAAKELEEVVEERTSALQEALDHLQELDQVKTEFISLASHQLRTPLTSLRWAQHALLEGSAGELSDSQKEIVATTLDRIVYMMTLVNELLDVTRIEDQKYELKVVKTDMYATLTRIAGEFKDTTLRKKIKFVVDIPETLPEAMIDEDKVEMAITNLLDNAVKYTDPGGKVTLRATKDDNAVRIQVIDTGIGISEKDQYRIFSKFFRAGNAISKHTVGSGLGMYIAKTIAEKHGGTIELESEEGKGTTFTLTIPLEQTAEGLKTQSEAAELKRVKDLGAITSLVEDEEQEK